MSSSPIFPIQELYYQTILKRIYSRLAKDKGEIVESFELESIVDNLRERLEPLEGDIFTSFATVKRADGRECFLLCVHSRNLPYESRTSRTLEEVIQRIADVSLQGNRTSVESCASYRSAKTLADYLESLEFVCEVVDRFVFISW